MKIGSSFLITDKVTLFHPVCFDYYEYFPLGGITPVLN